MAPTPPVLVVDDGELDEVRSVLQGLDLDYAYVRGAAIPRRFAPPSDGLLIATARRALALPDAGLAAAGIDPSPGLTRIVVVDEESPTLRIKLRGVGFDFLVRQPVHRAALRLLILRALYRGPEQRGTMRAAVGYDVSYRSGWRRGRASLVEISKRGCRLLTPTGLKVGASIKVRVPAEIAAGAPFHLAGRVVRCAPGESGEFSVGVAFTHLSDGCAARLDGVLEQRAVGPATVPSQADAPPPSRAQERRSAAPAPGKSPKTEPDADPAPTNRRRQPRYRFPEKVVALADQANRVLMGRELSVGGMRIEPHHSVALNDRLTIALYGTVGDAPLLVQALVERDDGALGLALRFDKFDAATAARLERFVATLPPIEPLWAPESDNLGAVVSEIRFPD